MVETTAQNINEERARLTQEISRLRQQVDASARQYQSQLQEIRQEMSANLRQANAELVRQHRQQLDHIATTYNAQREALSHAITRQKELLTQMIAEQDRHINCRIGAMEQRMEEQMAAERSVADNYRARMHEDWSTLRSQNELRPFTDPYVSIIEKADTDADAAYNRRQYQAVTAIMVNSSAMIGCWEAEARSLREEWQALRNLCQDMRACMQATLDSIRQPIDCDGVSQVADIKRYDPDLYARAVACCQGYATRLAAAERLTIEELRSLLHTMEQDQHTVQDAVEHLICLHRSHVRRLRCLASLKKGLSMRSYVERQVVFLDNNLCNGLKVRYEHRYHGDQLLVCITTPDPQAGYAEVSVTLLPGTAMDSLAQNALCGQMSDYVAACLRQQPRSPMSAHAAPVYIESSGLCRSNVTMQYRV